MKLADAIQYVAAFNAPVQHRLSHSGLHISIEHPRGTQRVIKNDKGKVVWNKYMHHHYGYLDKTKGRDGDEVDVIVGPLTQAKDVYVIHMLDKGPDVDARQDEDKVMLGFPSAEAAKQAFLTQYPESFFGGMSVLPLAAFKKRLAKASLPNQKRKIHARA